MVKVNELNSLMCQLSDHGCTDGFCCYNKINNDLFLNNCNLRHSGFACLFLFVDHRVLEEGFRSWLKRINTDGVALRWLQISCCSNKTHQYNHDHSIGTLKNLIH